MVLIYGLFYGLFYVNFIVFDWAHIHIHFAIPTCIIYIDEANTRLKHDKLRIRIVVCKTHNYLIHYTGAQHYFIGKNKP